MRRLRLLWRLWRLRSHNPRIRVAACKSLGELGDLRAVEPLLARVQDADRDVCCAAQGALVELGPKAVEPLIAALSHGDLRESKSACQLLAIIGDARAVEPLIARLDDRDADMRRWVCRALGQLRDVRAVEPLVGALEGRDANVRQAAVEALGKIADPRAAAFLVPFLSFGDPELSRTAADALACIGAPAASALVPALWSAEKKVNAAVGQLLERIGWTPADVRQRAALHVAHRRWGEAERMRAVAVPFLIQAFDEGTSPVEDREAIQGAIAAGGAEAARSLLGRLRRPFPPDRGRPLIETLACIDDPASVEQAVDIFDRGPDASKIAADVLGRPEYRGSRLRAEFVNRLVLRLSQPQHAAWAAQLLTDLGWTPATMPERLSFAIAVKDWDTVKSQSTAGADLLVRVVRVPYRDFAQSEALRCLADILKEHGPELPEGTLNAIVAMEDQHIRRFGIDQDDYSSYEYTEDVSFAEVRALAEAALKSPQRSRIAFEAHREPDEGLGPR
jgi:HEAT repeat protein